MNMLFYTVSLITVGLSIVLNYSVLASMAPPLCLLLCVSCGLSDSGKAEQHC